MNFQAHALEETLKYRTCREPNFSAEQPVDISSLFSGEFHNHVALLLKNRELPEGSREGEKDLTKKSATDFRTRSTHRDVEGPMGEKETEREPSLIGANEGQHIFKDGEADDPKKEMEDGGSDEIDDVDEDNRECEMILGDIPEVMVPSSRHNTLLKITSSSPLPIPPKKKRLPNKDKAGETGDISAASAQGGESTIGSAAANRYACRKCSLIFSKFEFLNAHISKIHPVIGPYRCPNCAFETKFHSMLQLHMKEPHAGDTTKVNAKQKKIAGKKVDEPRMKCPLCAYEASSLANFTTHSRTSHRNAFEKVAHRNASTSRYRCPFRPACSYQAKDRDDLENHYKTEHKQRLWHCPECDFYAVWKVALNRHLKAHRENPEHECGRCGQRFALKSYLNRHYNESECKEMQISQDQTNDSTINKKSSPAGCLVTPASTIREEILTSDRNGEVPLSTLSPASSTEKDPLTEDDCLQKIELSVVNTIQSIDFSNSLAKHSLEKSMPPKASPSQARSSLLSNTKLAFSSTAVIEEGQAVPDAQIFSSENVAIICNSPNSTSLAQMKFRTESRPMLNTLVSPSPNRDEYDEIDIANSQNMSQATSFTMSADHIKPPSIDAPPREPYRVTNENPLSTDDDPWGVPVAQSHFNQDNTARKSREGNSHGQVTLTRKTVQCTKTTSSHNMKDTLVTIVWNSGLPGIMKGFRSDGNSVKTKTATSTVQIRTSDDDFSKGDQVLAVKKHFDLTASRKGPDGRETDRHSNLLVSDKCSKKSLSQRGCDINPTPSNGFMVVSSCREASPPPLVIDDSITSD
ncbi:myoneurin-like isoform X2 [Varroa jacobsoni]|nr:myoneurin-like isoform X2 [Varroa jacobsoni]